MSLNVLAGPADSSVTSSVLTSSGVADAPRLASVDAFRGFAALGVAWFHIYTQNGNTLVSQSAPAMLNLASVWGRFGVQLFFAISGVVLCYTLFSNRGLRQPQDVARYLLRRSVRLDPTYWAILCLYIAVWPFLNAVVPEPFAPRDYSNSELVTNIIYFFWPLSLNLYMPVAWTLAIEVQFYVLFAFFMLIVNQGEKGWGIERGGSLLFLVLISGVLSLVQKLGVLTMPGFWLYQNMHSFVAGMLIGLAVNKVRYSSALFVSFLAALILIGIRNKDSYILASAVSGVALYVGLFVSWVRNLLSSIVLQIIGMLSYCIYLLHMLVGAAIVYTLQTTVSSRPGLHQVIFILLALIGTILVAAGVYLLVERPTIRLSKTVRLRS
jgi:peptidoglycan/LPS O-acetylase OafA/YrhL